jgi:hypothetical protein
MQLKPITAIVVLLLVVVSLLVSGCSTNTNNQTPSVAPSTATHDAFLEQILAAYKDTQYSNSSRQIKAYELDWINSTSTRLQNTFLTKPSIYSNITTANDLTFTVFPTSQDATQYLNAMNKTAYSLASTLYIDFPGGLAYKNVTCHSPSIFKSYQWNVDATAHQITQVENIVYVGTIKTLSSS